MHDFEIEKDGEHNKLNKIHVPNYLLSTDFLKQQNM